MAKEKEDKLFSIDDIVVILKHLLIDSVGWGTAAEHKVFADSHDFVTDLGYCLRSIEVHKKNDKDILELKKRLKSVLKSMKSM